MNGAVGWVVMAIYILIWDIMSKETLSSAFYRALESPLHRWWVIFIWVVITLHLFKLVPKKYDLIDILINFVKDNL